MQEQRQMTASAGKTIFKFLGALALTCAAALGLFVLWGVLSYRFRFSPALIRAGLTAWYVVPCIFGGRLLRALRLRSAFALLLGACFYGIVYAAAVICYGSFAPSWQTALVPVLMLAGALLGAIGKRR